MKTPQLILVLPLAGLVFAGAAIQAPGQSAPTLTVTNNLQLWLEADAGVTTNAAGAVTAWGDQSGQGYVATQVDESLAPSWAPNAIKGYPVVHFDGATRYLDIFDAPGLAITGNITIFCVLKCDDFNLWRAIWAQTPAGNAAPNEYRIERSSGLPFFIRGSSAAIGTVSATQPMVAGEYAVIAVEANGEEIAHYLNGATNGTGTISIPPEDEGVPPRIGSRNDLVTQMKGDIAELLVYNTALEETERKQVFEYLGYKYDLISLPPETLPPNVELTGPADNTTYSTPTNIVVTAEASDPDGLISQVQFFANGTLIATATAEPYSVPLSIKTPGDLMLSAVAIDNLGVSTNSDVINLHFVESQTHDYTPGSALKLWLKADSGVTTNDAGAVTAWADQSGQGNIATQPNESSAPLLVPSAVNGHSVVRFDGTTQYLDFLNSPGLAITGDMSLFCLAKCDDFGVWRAIWAQTEAGNAWPNEYRLQRDTGVPLFIRGGSVTQFKSIQVSGARAMKAGEYSVLGVEAAGQNITHFMNGVPNGTGVITVTPEASLVSTPRIGSRDDQVTQMKGDIAELLVFDAAISSQEQDDLANYLMAKYGILLFQVANQRPSVNLTNMATGDTIIPPADLVLTAASEDSDGSVARVDFYANGALLSSVSNAPYQLPVRVEQAAGSVNSRVTFTVVAVDNLGFNATSAPVSLKVASEGASTNMTVTSSLQLWLKADAGVTTNPGGAVTGWADQSGLGYVAAQYEDSIAPVLVPNVINGHPVVRFNGTTQYLDINGAPDLTITGDISIFCVVECDDFDVWRAIWAQTPSGNAAPNEYRIQITSGLPFFIRGGPNDLDTVTATRPLTAGEFAMLGVEAEGQAITHFLNGATNGSGTISVTPVDGGVAPRIGSRNDLVTQMKGDIAELLVYNRALSEAERMSLANYLATKYNLFTDAVVHVIESPAVPELNALRQSDGTVLVTWPESFVDFILESASGFPATDWTSVSGVESNSVTIAPSERSRFYRLRKP